MHTAANLGDRILDFRAVRPAELKHDGQYDIYGAKLRSLRILIRCIRIAED
jgi:hypothetical protein